MLPRPLPSCTPSGPVGNTHLLKHHGPLLRSLIHLPHAQLPFGGLFTTVVPMGLGSHHSPDCWIVCFWDPCHILLRSRPAENLLDHDMIYPVLSFTYGTRMNILINGTWTHPILDSRFWVHVYHDRRKPSVPKQPMEDAPDLDIRCDRSLRITAHSSCCIHLSICHAEPAGLLGQLSGRRPGPCYQHSLLCGESCG